MKSIDEYKKQWKEIGEKEDEKGIEEFTKKINIDSLIEKAIRQGEKVIGIKIGLNDIVVFKKMCEKYNINYEASTYCMNTDEYLYVLSGWAE